jgi:hypothetical protein
MATRIVILLPDAECNPTEMERMVAQALRLNTVALGRVVIESVAPAEVKRKAVLAGAPPPAPRRRRGSTPTDAAE